MLVGNTEERGLIPVTGATEGGRHTIGKEKKRKK
jgi:hypothetical protein